MLVPFELATEIIAGLLTLRIDEIAAYRFQIEDHNDFPQRGVVEDPIPTYRADLPTTDDFFA